MLRFLGLGFFNVLLPRLHVPISGILADIGYDGVITYEISPLRYSLADVLSHIAAEAAR